MTDLSQSGVQVIGGCTGATAPCTEQCQPLTSALGGVTDPPQRGQNGVIATNARSRVLVLPSTLYCRHVSPRCVRAAGAVIQDGAGRLLLIRRGHEPSRGLWSLPGGQVEADESAEQAVVREVEEETGLVVAVGDELGSVDVSGDHGAVYAVQDFRCIVVGGALRAGDDATDVGWFSQTQIVELATSPGLTDYLREWGILAE